MNIRKCECELKDIRRCGDRSFGTQFVMVDGKQNAVHILKVDESISRVTKRIKENLEGIDERGGVFLTNGMTNIDLDTTSEMWTLYAEGDILYVFDKNDAAKVLQQMN